MAFIEPLSLEKIFVNVLSGSPDIFIGLALLVIFGMAGYFRMNMLVASTFVGIFLLMFSSFISSPIVILFFIIGGLLLGFTLAKVFN
jgi:hypothetical protein